MMSQGHNYTAAAQSKSSFQGPTRPSNESEEAFYNMQALRCLLLPSLAAETPAENLSPQVFFQASSEFGGTELTKQSLAVLRWCHISCQPEGGFQKSHGCSRDITVQPFIMFIYSINIRVAPMF